MGTGSVRQIDVAVRLRTLAYGIDCTSLGLEYLGQAGLLLAPRKTVAGEADLAMYSLPLLGGKHLVRGIRATYSHR